MSKQDFYNNCFSPNWLEIDLAEAEVSHSKIKEERLESNRRKDLETLLKELGEIKQNIERAVQKQQYLAKLMESYT